MSYYIRAAPLELSSLTASQLETRMFIESYGARYHTKVPSDTSAEEGVKGFQHLRRRGCEETSAKCKYVLYMLLTHRSML